MEEFAKCYFSSEEIISDYAGMMYNLLIAELAMVNGGQVASERKSKDGRQPTTGAAAAGILALLVDAREARVKDDREATKTEVLLDSAGLSIEDIAAVMNKRYDAVRVSLQRNKAK